MVFEEKGKYLIDSREISNLVEKEHRNLLRDIRLYCDYLAELNFELSKYFIESSYTDSTGRELPCYLCTKKGCDMIANKLTGKKGVIFTAKYVEAFEKMKEFIEQGRQLNNRVPFAELVKSVEIVADSLKINEASKILMYEKLYKSLGQPTEFLPHYELNGSKELKSATSLLKENGFNVSAVEFNEKMREQGYLDKRSRKSSKGSIKYYNSLTLDGLKYGENAISPHNQRETQPLYYKNTFKTLFQEIFGCSCGNLVN